MTDAISFEWDNGNEPKILRHGLTREEVESVFDSPRMEEPEHVNGEDRIWSLGITSQGRCAVVVYTMRENRVRVVTAHISSRLRRFYEENIGS